jgi:redox-sensitive bicupin YhaK (pirin superfamily)
MDSTIELLIPARDAQIAEGMTVKRILPHKDRRMIGPFAFLDHMGPLRMKGDGRGDVPPHPHIGLSTVTFLFEGELMHRDSLGSQQRIIPGDVNWMTAGKGIVHSERGPEGLEGKVQTLHGLQAWVALPLDQEEVSPSFQHCAKDGLPFFDVDGVPIRLIAGSAFGKTAPAKTHSPLFYFEAKMKEGKSLSFSPPEDQEAAIYLVSGSVKVGSDLYASPQMIVFKPGVEIVVESPTAAHLVILGGKPLEGRHYIYWNFVASSREKIEEAKIRWRDQQFPKVPGETEFVPLPEGAFSVRTK